MDLFIIPTTVFQNKTHTIYDVQVCLFSGEPKYILFQLYLLLFWLLLYCKKKTKTYNAIEIIVTIDDTEISNKPNKDNE